MKARNLSESFTVLELLVVISIIGVIAAIAFPTISAAKRQAKITDNLSRLHSCQLAVALYRVDHEGDGALGLGLPDLLDIVISIKEKGDFYGAAKAQWQSACATHPNTTPHTFTYFPGDDPSALKEYAEYGESTILLADEQCSDPGVDVSATYVTKLGMGVRLDGTLVRRMRKGDVDSFSFWRDP